MKILQTDLFKQAGIGEVKDMRPGRSVRYRTDRVPEEEFQSKWDAEMSGEGEKDESSRLDDVWLDALRKQKAKEKEQQPVMAFVACVKK